MLAYLLNIILSIILIHNYILNNYNDNYRDVLISISYNMIYYFSVLEIYISKIDKKMFNSFICSFNQRTIDTNDVGAFKLVAKKNECGYVLWKLIYPNDPNVSDDNNVITQSNISFLLVEFSIGDKVHLINLKNPFENFYVVGNKFTKEFFISYVNKFKKINMDDIRDTCKLHILDNHVNEINLTFENDNYIEINEFTYTIHPN